MHSTRTNKIEGKFIFPWKRNIYVYEENLCQHISTFPLFYFSDNPLFSGLSYASENVLNSSKQKFSVSKNSHKTSTVPGWWHSLELQTSTRFCVLVRSEKSNTGLCPVAAETFEMELPCENTNH